MTTAEWRRRLRLGRPYLLGISGIGHSSPLILLPDWAVRDYRSHLQTTASLSSSWLYIRKRGEGELAVRAVFPDAVVVRPAVMFGPNDAFLTRLLALLRTLPIFPMFGRGLTRLQPVYVGDVAEAIAKAIEQTEKGDRTFECGGPRVYSYEELLRALMRETGLEARLIPMPFAAWHTLARLAEMLPNAPVTRNQIELMQVDTVASRDVPGFAELGISPRSVEDILREMLACPSGGR